MIKNIILKHKPKVKYIENEIMINDAEENYLKDFLTQFIKMYHMGIQCIMILGNILFHVWIIKINPIIRIIY